MGINRIELKRAARDAMRAAPTHPVLATLLYFLLSIGLQAIFWGSSAAFGYNPFAPDDFYTPIEYALYVGGLSGTIVFFAYILINLFSIILEFGYSAVYAPGVARRDPVHAGTRSFFYGFSRPVPILAAFFLTNIFIFLWTLLFIIPGFVAFYRYRLTFLLLAENPDMGAMAAIRESAQLMRGFKLDAFLLDLSFLGWILLSALTLGVLFFWVQPYMAVTDANFYYTVRAAHQPREHSPGPDAL